MEEIVVPTESLEEEIHHRAEHERGWFSGVALSSALLAVFAAIAALLSGHHANEAMMDQIQASDHWAYYQAKGIKASVLQSKITILQALGKSAVEGDEEKLSAYKNEQDEISEKAKEKENEAQNHLSHHVIFARGVTLFQIAIAVAAISVLTRRKRFWYVGIGFGVLGLGFLIQGLILK